MQVLIVNEVLHESINEDVHLNSVLEDAMYVSMRQRDGACNTMEYQHQKLNSTLMRRLNNTKLDIPGLLLLMCFILE